MAVNSASVTRSWASGHVDAYAAASSRRSRCWTNRSAASRGSSMSGPVDPRRVRRIVGRHQRVPVDAPDPLAESPAAPVEPRNFHREFKTRCRKARVREISVHTTRPACTTLLVALDVHPRVMMRILRHSQIAVTMNVYARVASEAAETALTRLGDQFL
ncbi:hypothetical protein [Micromonospora sp. NPDC004551]|uniref:hypothetical protein n=1 Tax=Micromonospora sp. NPDC004551 TaxID=3154284 RepID=UPI0033BC05BA